MSPHPQEPNPEGSAGRRGEGGGGEGERSGAEDSPVGVRGLVDDVLVAGEQDQSVLAEIHSHVCAAASIQTAADGERRGVRAEPGGGGAAAGGADWCRQRGRLRLCRVLAPEPLGPVGRPTTGGAGTEPNLVNWH